MGSITYNKLVRDLVPEEIRANGDECVTRTISGDEFKDALRKKLIEETEEVVKAENPELLKWELADVLEVVEALIAAHKIDPNDVAECKKEKKRRRGGFTKGVMLESASEM